MERLTRRRLLIGSAAGAVVVAGGGVMGAERTPRARRWLHSAGLLPGPDQQVPQLDVAVEYGEFDSAAARRRVGYGLHLPAGPVKAVLYCLHGMGGSHRDPFDHLGVHRFVAAAGLPWAVASVDGGTSYWHPRSDGSDTQAMLVDEFLPRIAARAPGARAVALGWSMGGFGALLVALDRPRAFDVVVASSPALWLNYAVTASGAFDSAADFAAHDVVGSVGRLSGRAVRIDCGDDDPFAGAVRQVHAAAPAMEVDLRAGFHDDASWRSFLSDQLRFIGGHLRP